MKNIKAFWSIISNLGINNTSLSLSNRSKTLSNQLNFIILVISLVIVLILTVMRKIEHESISWGSYRFLIILGINLINIFLAKKGFFKLFKSILISIPVFVFFILPTLFGFVEEESFFYYPFVIITFSILPLLILNRKEEPTFYYISILYYITLIIACDILLTIFSPKTLNASILIKEFYVYYKIVPLFIFAFIHIAINYLRNINYSYEFELINTNKELNTTINQLKSAQQQLVQSEKMASIGTLTSGIAHELNNPLNFINGGIQIISKIEDDLTKDVSDKLKQKYNTAVKIISEGIDRSTKIVKALNSFSYHGKPVLVMTNINDIIDNCLFFLNSKISDDINIEKKYLLNIGIAVYPDKIHQVIMNVLDNALYALKNSKKKDKKISIKTSIKGENILIEIANNGNKIPNNKLNQIFDPFFTTKHPNEGTGLGLSISMNLMKDHQGKIGVCNLYEGVLFIIEIPLKKETTAQ